MSEGGEPEGRTVFQGSLLRVRVERARLPDGTTVEREVVRHPGAAGVLPFVSSGSAGGEEGDEGQVLLLRQHRHAAGRTLWEIPAGTLEEGESPESCAARELEEEAGLSARRLTLLGRPFTTPGFTDERIHLYLARETTPVEARPEPEERLERVRLPFRRAVAMATRGEIGDAKTLCAILLAARVTNGNEYAS